MHRFENLKIGHSIKRTVSPYDKMIHDGSQESNDTFKDCESH